jgi:hypothetical protein
LVYSVNKYYDEKTRSLREERYDSHNLINPGEGTLYRYNEAGQIIYLKAQIGSMETDSLVIYSKYDSKGNKILEESSERFNGKVIQNLEYYTFNDKNQKIEKKRVSLNTFSGNKTEGTKYYYDEIGRLSDQKEYENEKLIKWVQFVYNKTNLVIEEIELDIKSKKPSIVFLYKYNYY